MNLPRYPVFKVDPNEYVAFQAYIEILGSWKFFSEGKNGRYELRVVISRLTVQANTIRCNLGFGVWNAETREIDDLFEIRNSDTQNILATVAELALNFLKENPELELYAEGSTSARTRLYQREIRKIISSLPAELSIYGLLRSREEFVEFEAGINFDAFLLLVQ